VKRLMCVLFGHAPRGPITGNVYGCVRCGKNIFFDDQKRKWVEYRPFWWPPEKKRRWKWRIWKSGKK
jgi:hypothetical protein